MNTKPTYIHSIIGMACSALMICSCNSEPSVDGGIGASGPEVTFAVHDESRAATTTSFDNFAVYGDIKFMELDRDVPTVLFDKAEVVKTDNGWQYQGARYWFPNHEHSFVAIHPLSVLDAAQYADSKLSFNYTLPASNDDAADIITATHRRLYHEGDAVTPIFFQFGHLLSLINFSVELTEPSMKSDECFKIHKLEMTGFGTSATINIKPAPRLDNPQTNDSKIDIVTTKGNGSLEINFAEPIKVTNGAGSVKMFDGNDAIILLPQTFEADDKVQISLTYSANNETETTRATATLSNFTWESGKSYNYKVKLELGEAIMVISNATIAPWNPVEDPNIVDAR